MVDYRVTPRTICVILGGGQGTRLHPLTRSRAKPAVPLGGKYRLIDVPISNCLNSGLNKIYVLTQFQSASLHRHVTGTYRFDRFGEGFIEILAAEQTHESSDWYQGTADAVRQNLLHFGNSWDDLLILSGDQLYHMDYQDLIANHNRHGADISIAVLPVDAQSATSLGITQLDESGRVNGFVEKPSREKLKGLEADPNLLASFKINADGRPCLASMGIYVFNRDVLVRELMDNDYVDFGKHVFPAMIDKYRVQAFVFDGYWEDIGTVASFHEANLGMAKVPPTFSFQRDGKLIFTRPRTLPGTVIGKLDVNESIIADGCQIADATLNGAVVGLRSMIGSGVQITRSLLMGADAYETDEDRARNRELDRPDIGVGNNVVIEDAIIDKNVRIGSDVVIANPNSIKPAETSWYVVRDGVICVLKDATVHSGTKIGV